MYKLSKMYGVLIQSPVLLCLVLLFSFPIKCMIIDLYTPEPTEVDSTRPEETVPRAATPGIIVYRKSENFIDEVEYLLIQSLFGTQQWFFPKGKYPVLFNRTEHIVVRVLFDQTTLRKRDVNIVPNFMKFSHIMFSNGAEISYVYYLAELKPGRKVVLSGYFKDFKWLQFKEAYAIAKHNDKREVLKACHEHLRKLKVIP